MKQQWVSLSILATAFPFKKDLGKREKLEVESQKESVMVLDSA